MRAMLIVSLLIMLTADLVLLGFSLTRKERSRSLYYSVLCAAAGLYLFGYLLEAMSPSLDAAKIALAVQNAGIPLMGPFLLLFMLSLCRPLALRTWMGWVAGIYSFSMFLLVLFNDYHHLYYSSVEFLPVADFWHLSLGRGPLYFLQQAVVIFCTLSSCIILFLRMMHSTPKGRRQVQFIVYGVLASFLVNVLYAARILPQVFDPTPFALTLGLLLNMVSILRYKLFDIVPAASERMIQEMDSAVVILDTDWCYQSSNPAARRLFPALRPLQGTESLQDVEHWPSELQPPLAAVDTISFSLGEGIETRFYRAQVNPVRAGHTLLGWSLLIQDVTESVQLMDQLRSMAATDFLTGIYNRRYFWDAVQRQLALARREGLPCSLVLFDLDHFKAVNDTYGHQAGDSILCSVVETIRQQLRPYDIFARYGGEEFVIFSLGMGLEAAESFAVRLCGAAASAAVNFNGIPIRVTASFGVVEFPWGCTLEEATIAADRAMYRAKAKGRNRVEVGYVRRSRIFKKES